jgi:nuclear receptor subfamily 1 group D protein 3
MYMRVTVLFLAYTDLFFFSTLCFAQCNSMVTLNGQVLRRESVCAYSNARFLTDSMFEFAERLNAMRLNDSEIGLFNAVIVIAAGKRLHQQTVLL